MGIDTPDVIELSRADRLSALGEAVTKEMLENTGAEELHFSLED